jgi:hypothetical protein
MAELAFDTTVNYQKIYMEGSAALSIANPNARTTTSITHNLGYIPNVRVWFTNASGKICPAVGEIGEQLLGGDFVSHMCRYRVNTTTLTLVLDRVITVGPTINSTLYYRIYLDAA